MIDRIHLLNVLGIQVSHAETLETRFRKLRVVSYIGEEFVTWTFAAWEAFLQVVLVDHVVDLTIQRIADETFAKHATQEILLIARSEHEGGRN